MAESVKDRGVKAAFYHAGLAKGDRVRVQNEWGDGRVTVIVATIAFGMGRLMLVFFGGVVMQVMIVGM